MIRRALICLLLLVASACTSASDQAPTNDVAAESTVDGETQDLQPVSGVAGTSWVSTEVRGIDLEPGAVVWIEFEGGEFTTQIACNSFEGPYEVASGRLGIGYESTRQSAVGCPEPEESWDDWLFDLLTSTPTFELDGNSLTVGDGADRVTFEPGPRPSGGRLP